MIIWTVTTDTDNGINTEAFATEASAKARFAELVAESWAYEFHGEREMPDDPMEAYHDLTCRPGFDDYLTIQECEVQP